MNELLLSVFLFMTASRLLYGLLACAVAFACFRVYRYIRELQADIVSIRQQSQERIENLESQLYAALHDRQPDGTEPDGPETEAADLQTTEGGGRFQEKITAFIRQHIDDAALSVQDVAHEMAMSRSLLYLQTKTHLGCTPNNLIVDLRMEHAMLLIRQPETNIADIAYSCGFRDPKYFARCFKKATGMTPSDYRKKYC